MALQVMRGIRYMDTVPDSPEYHFSFVHEILRTKEEEQFRDPHTHGQYHKIIFFNSGTRDIKVGSRVENCGPGDILVLAHGELYCGRSHDTFLDRYTLHIGVHALDCFGSFGKELMRQFTDRVLYTDNRFRLPKEIALQVNALLADTDRLLHIQTKDPSIYMEAMSNVIKILSLMKQSRKEQAHPGIPYRTMLRILAYMDSNYNRNITAEDICREFAVSRSGLWRMFRQYLNQTPGEYLRRIRMENARYILEQGESVTDACMECGFTDCSHFIRLFREAYGVTPYQYKKEHSADSGKERM